MSSPSAKLKADKEPFLQPEIIPLLRQLPQAVAQGLDYTAFVKKFPQKNGRLYTKTEVLKAYSAHTRLNGLPIENQILLWLRKKPTRSLSGVTPITVLTKPFPCPGTCIFCPNDVRMPKSYLSSEPGAQRGALNFFDPYLQTYNRLLNLKQMGHPISKAEVIVLGGTWSVYPLPYRIWFVKRIFDALNDFGMARDRRPSVKPSLISVDNSDLPQGKTYNQAVTSLYQAQETQKGLRQQETATWEQLTKAQELNETAPIRCVGLVLESRPDTISAREVLILRRLGATKTQIGLQSLQDKVLALNRRGHNVAASRAAFSLLRQAGFKIHAHWMPNLYGSNVSQDKADYRRLFKDPDFKPDELKIYPCSLIKNTPLVSLHQSGKWRPYTHQELLDLLSYCLTHTPYYCRLTRIIRDIPSPDILTGNILTNFRELAQSSVKENSGVMQDIRAREVKSLDLSSLKLKLKVSSYPTSTSTEYFLQFVTLDDRLAAFLRLSLPADVINSLTHELDRCAVIREVHVYGQAVELSRRSPSKAQHQGLGKRLIKKAMMIAKIKGYHKLSVISAVGTREYYRRQGFEEGRLYQHCLLSDS